MRAMSRLTLALGLLAACGDAGGFPDAAVPDAPQTGTFSLTWSVIDQDSVPLACSQIAATTMTVLAHNKAFLGGETQVFTCDTGMGQSQAVIGGTYDLDFELSSPAFGLLATATPLRGIELSAGVDTPLDPIVFQVEALGDLELTLSTGQPGGNCGGGAGIETMTITVTHQADGTCEPITFTISQGATQPGGTYTADCTTPAVVGCIDSDQTLSATDVPSDRYTLSVRGMIGGAACWRNDDTIQSPPLGKTLTRTLNLSRSTSTPGC